MIKGIYARFQWVRGLFNGTTGHSHSGVDGQGPVVSGSGTGLFLLPYLLWRHTIGSEFTGYTDIQMQISSDPLFATSLYDLDSGTLQTGWKAFSSASATYLTWQPAGWPSTDLMGIAYIGTLTLVPGTKYYVRFRVYEHGTTNYGDYFPGGSI